MKKLLFILLLPFMGFSQEYPFKKDDVTVNELLKGSLYTPSRANTKTDLVIIIAGSGMPDRDGNQQGMENNSLRCSPKDSPKMTSQPSHSTNAVLRSRHRANS
jgi:hypothetical protein